jgi:hypothetical protein
MEATADHKSLHFLTKAQERAVHALATGSTHAEVALAAGVHRVTVTKWASHHPEFVAELNRLRTDAAAQTEAQIARITGAALECVEEAVKGGDLASAFKWLRLISPTGAAVAPAGPISSSQVVEQTRREMPSLLFEMLARDDERSSDEAESLLVARLEG